MKEYVVVCAIPKTGCGFVLLVKKDRPEWQKGRFNLPGGKIEEGETPDVAAMRELREETNLEAEDLLLMGKIVSNTAIVYVFSAIVDENAQLQPREGETEQVVWVPWKAIGEDKRLIPNLRVIIPLVMADVCGWEIHDKADFSGKNTHQIQVVIPCPLEENEFVNALLQ